MTIKPLTHTLPVTNVVAKRRHDLMDGVIGAYSGQLGELESALGMYMVGRHLGWRVLYIIHSKTTVRRYETILGIRVREEFDEEGPDAWRSVGLRAAQEQGNFWRVVSGALKIDNAGRGLIE